MQPCILIADDHSIIRIGLKIFMQVNLGYKDVHEVSTCNNLMKELIKKKYTHLILDIILSDGNTLEVIPNIRRVYPELNIMIFSNAIGIPLIAIIQGVVALLGYLIFGVPQPVFWFAVTCFCAMLPIIGAAAVYVPMGVYLIAAGHTWQGIAILIYGFVVVGASDNIFRMLLAKKIGDVHPLITVFGVIVGVNLFGFIGLIFGPLLISMFILLLKIYSNEYLVKKREVKVIKTGPAKVKP